jgi:hypothetical protein
LISILFMSGFSQALGPADDRMPDGREPVARRGQQHAQQLAQTDAGQQHDGLLVVAGMGHQHGSA